ncbi:hypothetical protein GMLC_09210 [Geomonas limicola]|uniref:Methyl-accepting chemotaxis protein n=1 Tax=Geomonas limicola TaxID=2740186 RepID=A0A6V8N482_9BACT|nr:methyl-accepting chemotaxis protein [Geomonas limicola]GFO67342.1 hypothetical protein GMLC_09210 [Geomonas limicola]
MKLRTKVNLTVVLVFAVVIAALIVTAATSSRKIMGKILNDTQIALAKDNAAGVNAWMLAKQGLIQAGAKDLSKYPDQPRDYITNEIKILAEAGGFATVYPGYENGLFISSDGWVPAADWDHRKRPWYEKAKAEQKVSQTEPYIDAQTGKPIISFIAPITDQGKFAGVLSSDIMLDEVVKKVLDVKVGESGYAYIIDKDGKILIHPDKNLVLKKKFQDLATGVTDLPGKLASAPSGSFEYQVGNDKKVTSYALIPATGWYLCVAVPKAEIFAPVATQTATLATLGVVALVIGVVILVLFVRTLLQPLGLLSERITDLAEGEGDLTRRIEVGERNDEIGQLARELNKFIGSMQGIVSQIVGASRTLTGEASQLTATSTGISVGAEAVAGQTANVATASEEMAATASDIARSCHHAADSAQVAADTTQQCFSVVTRTVNGIRERGELTKNNARGISSLGERSEQIGAIVATIEDIADQTNLLALNAAIEAARAGEQGRGFAVVADEVRALAERTTKATREIGDMIRAIQQETQSAITSMEEGVRGTERGVEEAAELEGALASVLEQVNQVTMQVNQIATAAEEQTATTGEITANIQQVTSVVQETAAGAQESAQAAIRLSTLAGGLHQIVGKFKL